MNDSKKDKTPNRKRSDDLSNRGASSSDSSSYGPRQADERAVRLSRNDPMTHLHPGFEQDMILRIGRAAEGVGHQFRNAIIGKCACLNVAKRCQFLKALLSQSSPAMRFIIHQAIVAMYSDNKDDKKDDEEGLKDDKKDDEKDDKKHDEDEFTGMPTLKDPSPGKNGEKDAVALGPEDA
jgi:hypothetical protein